MRPIDYMLAVLSAAFGIAGSVVIAEWMQLYPVGHHTRELLFLVMIGVWIVTAVLLIFFLFPIVRARRGNKPPSLRCSFRANDIGGCVCPNTVLTRNFTETRGSSAVSWQERQTGTYYRVKVSAENETINGARGRLVSIQRGSAKIIAEAINLPFAPAEPHNQDRLNKTIHVGSPEHLDFMFITDTNRVELTPPDFAFPSAVRPLELFNVPGDYVLTIRVLAPAAEKEIVIVFKWTEDHKTCSLAAMN